jgi:hypothetical protein
LVASLPSVEEKYKFYGIHVESRIRYQLKQAENGLRIFNLLKTSLLKKANKTNFAPKIHMVSWPMQASDGDQLTGANHPSRAVAVQLKKGAGTRPAPAASSPTRLPSLSSPLLSPSRAHKKNWGRSSQPHGTVKPKISPPR